MRKYNDCVIFLGGTKQTQKRTLVAGEIDDPSLFTFQNMIPRKLARDTLQKPHPLGIRGKRPTGHAHMAAARKWRPFIFPATENPVTESALELIHQMLRGGKYNIVVQAILLIKNKKYPAARPDIRAPPASSPPDAPKI